MEIVNIFGTDYGFCRSAKCSYEDKHNRMVKIATKFEQLSEKFDGIMERGMYMTLSARCALACKMMMYTGIRIGNEGSAEGYLTKPHPNSKKQPEFVHTYGLTTLLPEHCTVDSPCCVVLNFVGKKQVENTFKVTGLLAKQFIQVLNSVEDGETVFEVTVSELNKFINRYVGKRFSAKDFRTLRANMVAWEKLLEISKRELPSTKSEFNKEVKEIAVHVSEHLNNTPGVCKASYIDPMFWSMLSESRVITKKQQDENI